MEFLDAVGKYREDKRAKAFNEWLLRKNNLERERKLDDSLADKEIWRRDISDIIHKLQVLEEKIYLTE
jgi:ribosomal protein L31E